MGGGEERVTEEYRKGWRKGDDAESGVMSVINEVTLSELNWAYKMR